jgi:hypothetical protein
MELVLPSLFLPWLNHVLANQLAVQIMVLFLGVTCPTITNGHSSKI